MSSEIENGAVNQDDENFVLSPRAAPISPSQHVNCNVKGEDESLIADPTLSTSHNVQNLNEDISNCNTKEIKNEPTETVEKAQEKSSENAEQTPSNQIEAENLPNIEHSEATVSEALPNKTVLLSEASKNSSNIEQESEPIVTVKEEPGCEVIDYGMPISKTPMHTNSAGSNQPLGKISASENQNVNASSSSLGNFASKAAFDEYMDGIVTPLAPPIPRLRVKNELALLKTPHSKTIKEKLITKNNENMETDVCLPPPPPTLSSNSNSAFVADGIATPRISLTSINRLRVKSEFSLPPPTPEHSTEDPSDSFFNDLIDTQIDEKEPGEVSPSMTDDASDNEPIPNDYFDDLLIDSLKEKIDQAQNNDLEIKYSDRLKELERLKSELSRMQEKKERKNRKKQKKSKKKSRKRSKSRSLSPHNRAKERKCDYSQKQSHYDRNRRGRTSPSREDWYSDSNYSQMEVVEEDILRVSTGYLDIKLEHPPSELDNFSKESCTDVVEEVLTPKQKKDRGVKRASALLDYIKAKSAEKYSTLSEFPFVSTVRKLPASVSYIQQHIYENRSPLHTVNNVQYKFNSHTTRFNMEEWGLVSLSPVAAKIAKHVGCDAEFIHNKLKTMKLPAKLKKIKQESNNDADNETEELVESSTSLYCNVMTQTDDMDELSKQSKEKGIDIGVQIEPELYSIECQTLEAHSSGKDKNTDLPIMNLIEELNENQLMAVHSFAELIKDQNSSSNAMEMYKIQMKIMEIYKMSQIPSALEAAQPPIVNNYTTITRPREQSQLCIQSVKSADGRQFTVSDSRHKPAAYPKRMAYDEAAAASLRYNDRYSHSNHDAERPSTSKGYSHTYFNATPEYDTRYSSIPPSSRYHSHNSQSPPPTVKHYGRGGLRR